MHEWYRRKAFAASCSNPFTGLLSGIVGISRGDSQPHQIAYGMLKMKQKTQTSKTTQQIPDAGIRRKRPTPSKRMLKRPSKRQNIPHISALSLWFQYIKLQSECKAMKENVMGVSPAKVERLHTVLTGRRLQPPCTGIPGADPVTFEPLSFMRGGIA